MKSSLFVVMEKFKREFWEPLVESFQEHPRYDDKDSDLSSNEFDTYNKYQLDEEAAAHTVTVDLNNTGNPMPVNTNPPIYLSDPEWLNAFEVFIDKAPNGMAVFSDRDMFETMLKEVGPTEVMAEELFYRRHPNLVLHSQNARFEDGKYHIPLPSFTKGGIYPAVVVLSRCEFRMPDTHRALRLKLGRQELFQELFSAGKAEADTIPSRVQQLLEHREAFVRDFGRCKVDCVLYHLVSTAVSRGLFHPHVLNLLSGPKTVNDAELWTRTPEAVFAVIKYCLDVKPEKRTRLISVLLEHDGERYCMPSKLADDIRDHFKRTCLPAIPDDFTLIVESFDGSSLPRPQEGTVEASFELDIGYFVGTSG